MGIISAITHRSIGSSDLDYFIQTDAAINPGNSGGALVTMDGRLVGINAAIYSRDGGNMGIGFAVPSNMVRQVLNAVTQGKKNVAHPWLGIEGQEVTPDLAASLGLPQSSGYLVKLIDDASPAGKAGLHVGDVITEVNGHEVDDPESFRYRVATLSVGTTAEFGIVRQGQKQSVAVPMIAPPESVPRQDRRIQGQNPFAGAKIANLSPAVAVELGVSGEGRGVVVTDVQDGSNAAAIGLQPGDILVDINGVKIATMNDADAALKQSRRAWRLTINRGGSTVTMVFSG